MKFDFNFKIGTLKAKGNTLKDVDVNTTFETTSEELTELLASHDKFAEMIVPTILKFADRVMDEKYGSKSESK